MGIASCDMCKAPITAGPISCSTCAVENAEAYAAHLRAESEQLRVALKDIEDTAFAHDDHVIQALANRALHAQGTEPEKENGNG